VEKRLVEAGWADLLLTVKVLHTPDNRILSKELVLTFIDAASAADFADTAITSSPALTWPGPKTTIERGPAMEDRYLLADLAAALASFGQLKVQVPDGGDETTDPSEQVIILVFGDQYKEAKTRVQHICAAWDGVKQVDHVPLTAAHFAYGEEASPLVLRPAALVTFSSGEAAAAAAAELAAANDDNSKAVVLVMRYTDYLSLPAKPFYDVGGGGKKKSGGAATESSAAKKKPPAKSDNAAVVQLHTRVAENEREITVKMPGGGTVAMQGSSGKNVKATVAKKAAAVVASPAAKADARPAAAKKESGGSKGTEEKNGVVVCWLSPKTKLQLRPEDAFKIKK
jgi:hypothetical protein